MNSGCVIAVEREEKIKSISVLITEIEETENIDRLFKSRQTSVDEDDTLKVA